MSITKLSSSTPRAALEPTKTPEPRKVVLAGASLGAAQVSESKATTETKAPSRELPDASKDISTLATKGVSTDKDGNTVFELHSMEGLKVTRVAGGEECDGTPERWELSNARGDKRELNDEEKKALATKLDRDVSGHDLKPGQEKLGREMLESLVQDPAIDTRWDAPNLLKDAALSEGKVTSRSRSEGLALGRQVGPMEQLTLSNGNSAELEVIRESAPRGPGSTPLFSKSIASGQYSHLVPLSRDEAVALRDNLRTQGPQNRETLRDLERYIRSLEARPTADSFERTNGRSPYERFVG